ncbi:MAG: hypothetical protein AUH75_09145 [Gemmatimonadetes bacterium 13_1_40CM_4_65_7]|nr:MAG: hypothetical protein AUH75_09145 [Gemmatimonadetes bacterium 13_1_40CM_4_65_7]
MDNLAHALVGAALMRAVADRHVPRAASIGILAANAPDLSELLIGLPGTRAEYLVLHRGITHSLIGAAGEIVVLTLLIGAGWRLARWILGRHGRAVAVPSWGWLAAGISAAILSHLYMDWQGSYGWRPFLPWSGTWYYLDWVGIVDPFFWLVPLVALAWGAERHWTPLAAVFVVGSTITFFLVRALDLAATWVLVVFGMVCVVAVIGWIGYWFGPVGRQRAAVLALLLLVAYAAAQAVVATGRKREIRQVAQRRFGPGASWAALTNVGRPFTWEAIYASVDTVAGDDWQLPRHLRAREVQRVITQTREGQAMAQFARFLAAEVDTSSATIYLWDARYARGSRDGWAVVKVRMD